MIELTFDCQKCEKIIDVDDIAQPHMARIVCCPECQTCHLVEVIVRSDPDTVKPITDMLQKIGGAG